MAGNTVERGRSVTSKVAAILVVFASGGTYSLSELARLTGLPTTTTHRLLGELTASRLLERTARGEYQLGYRLRERRAEPAADHSVREHASHMVEDLADATGLPVQLGVLRGLRVAYIEKSGRAPVTWFDAGATLPAHATALGKALLAFAPPPKIRALLRSNPSAFTERTLTRPDALLHALQIVRMARFALCDSELRRGVCGVAAPVFGPGGRVLAALALQVPDVSAAAGVRPALTFATRRLSRELGSCRIGRVDGARHAG